MKAIKFLVMALFITGSWNCSAISFADHDRQVTLEQLPATAQTFIKTHFAALKISYAMQDMELLDGEYEVRFTDGTKVDFTSKGAWKDVDCGKQSVPSAIVPAPIAQWVKANGNDATIVKIEIGSRQRYEIKLSNGMEAEFDKSGKFVRYDD